MEITGGEEEGFIREWAPCTHMLNLIPARVQNGLFSNELFLTCIDAVSEYIALGTNVGLVYWYDRKKGNIQRLRCEASTTAITFVKIVNTVDYMVGAGNAIGQVTVFQIPKEHPENVPDTLKPKVEPRVERYTIGDLHKSEITAIEWSKNGMRLFSGDKNGVIIMTEIDFYMHLCKSAEIVNEEHEIVQLSYHQSSLLVSSLYRCIVCELRDGRWHITQVGKKERKSLCRLGAVFQHSYGRAGAGGGGGAAAGAAAYCARAGLRLWHADQQGNVLQTLLFKDAVSNPLTVAELLNPSPSPAVTTPEPCLGPLHVYRERFLVSHNARLLCVLDPASRAAVALVRHLRRILSVSVNKEEIFVLEGPRSVVRLGHSPEPGVNIAEEPANLMTKSLTSSIQQAVNTVRDLTHIDQTVPFITSQAISIFTKGDPDAQVSTAEECFELPPVKCLPDVVSGDVLESIINEFRDTSEMEEVRRARTDELHRKLKLYNSIMERKWEGELIHSSRRGGGGRSSGGSGEGTPRRAALRDTCDGVSYTSPCLMNVSVYSDLPQDTDDKLLEQQIEEKEKILAKMLNLDSLSIKTPNSTTFEDDTDHYEAPPLTHRVEVPIKQLKENNQTFLAKPSIEKSKINDTNTRDLIPKLAKIPNNWNLDDIHLKLDAKNNSNKDGRLHIGSPEVNETEWEFV